MNSLFKLMGMLLLIGMMVIGFGSGSPAAPTIQASNVPAIGAVANQTNLGIGNLLEGANLNDPDVLVVTNTSGTFLPVIYGNNGAQVFLGNVPWTIAPGETFFSYSWGPDHYFFFGGKRFHYIGSIGTSDSFHFFLVPDWTS